MPTNKGRNADDDILVVGTGALASLFAARLAASGKAVLMLGSWQAAIEAINQNGLRVIDADGEQQFLNVRATANYEECRGIANALVLVKSWQSEKAAKTLARLMPADGLALSLQNGLGNAEKLIAELGEQRAALGSTTSGAALDGPGIVRPGGEGQISIAQHPRLTFLAVALKKAGFHVELVDDIEALLWGKLAINAAINPLTALLEIPNGKLLEDENLREWMGALAREVATVARAKEILFPFADALAAAIDVAARTSRNHSSMYQDIVRGAPTEIDAICGAVVRAGQELGMATPANQQMWDLIREKVRGREVKLEVFNAKPLS